MKKLAMSAFCALALAVGLTGCQSSGGVIRAQNADMSPVNYQTAYGDPVDCYDPGAGYYTPPQWYNFKYTTPRGLTYPAADAMPGVIQYPYYTVKGPDCFFYGGK